MPHSISNAPLMSIGAAPICVKYAAIASLAESNPLVAIDLEDNPESLRDVPMLAQCSCPNRLQLADFGKHDSAGWLLSSLVNSSDPILNLIYGVIPGCTAIYKVCY